MRILVCIALLLSACGQPAAPPVAPQTEAAAPIADLPTSGWASHLLEMMPFIDACISSSPNTRTVTFAAPTGEALVTVRLSGADPSVDCNVPDDDPNSAYVVIRPRREDWEAPGENAAIFVRGPGENPGGECYEAPEVRAADGALLGWMLDPEGC